MPLNLNPKVVSRTPNFNYSAALRIIDGIEPVILIGSSPASVGINQFVTVWEAGEFVIDPIDTPQILKLSSTDAADVGLELRIEGLLADGTRLNEVVTCNGQTPVNTVNQFSAVNFLAVTSTTSNQGDIYLAKQSATYSAGIPDDPQDFVTVIKALSNVSSTAYYTVPKDSVLLIEDFDVTVGDGNTTDIQLRIGLVGDSVGILKQFPLQNSGFDKQFKTPLFVEEGNVVEIRSRCDTQKPIVSSFVRAVLVNKTKIGMP